MGCSGARGDDQEVVLRRMRGVAGRLRVEDHRPVAPAHLRTPFLVTPTPPADTRDLEELRPLRERVIRGMNEHQAASAPNVIDKGHPGWLRPVVALVVHDDGAVAGKGGLEGRHVLAFGRRRDDGRLETARVVEHALDVGAADGPVVVLVALPGEDHHPDSRLRRRRPSRGDGDDWNQEKERDDRRRVAAHGPLCGMSSPKHRQYRPASGRRARPCQGLRSSACFPRCPWLVCLCPLRLNGARSGGFGTVDAL